MQPSHQYHITVQKEHIDMFNHVNNEVYLKWLIESADSHSTSLGYPLERYIKEGAFFIIRRHEIDYLAPAYLGEKLIVETWVEEMETKRCVRSYKIIREKDSRTIVLGKTLWVYVNLKTGRPIVIPDNIYNLFAKSDAN